MGAALTLVRETHDTRTLREFLDSLPTEYLECRRYRHAWTGETVGVKRSEYAVTLRCLRCKSSATETLSKRGHRKGRRVIHYVDGYLAKGIGRLTAEDNDLVRKVSTLRLVG